MNVRELETRTMGDKNKYKLVENLGTIVDMTKYSLLVP